MDRSRAVYFTQEEQIVIRTPHEEFKDPITARGNTVAHTKARDRICPHRPCGRDPCTIPRATGTPTNGDTIVKGGARKLLLALSNQSNPKVLADNLLWTRFG